MLLRQHNDTSRYASLVVADVAVVPARSIVNGGMMSVNFNSEYFISESYRSAVLSFEHLKTRNPSQASTVLIYLQCLGLFPIDYEKHLANIDQQVHDNKELKFENEDGTSSVYWVDKK